MLALLLALATTVAVENQQPGTADWDLTNPTEDTKALYLEEAPQAEPVADDLATLSLDILVGDAGWQRARLNWYLMPQDEDAPEPLSAATS